MMRKEIIMCRKNVLAIVAVVMLALAVDQVQAQSVEVPVPNGRFDMYKPGSTTITGSFSSGNVYSSGVGYGLLLKGEEGGVVEWSDATTGTVLDCPGWVKMNEETGTNDLWSAGIDTPGTCFNAFGSWSGGHGTMAVSEASLGTIIGASTYTLSAWVEGSAGPVVLDLLADGVAIPPTTAITPIDETGGTSGWEEMSRTYSASAIAPYVGQSMTIALGTYDETGTYYNPRTRFDNVTLSQELPPPRPITPDHGVSVSADLELLEWTFGEPNDPIGGTISCDVWFSNNYPLYPDEPNDPHFTDYATKIVDHEAVEQYELVNLPTELALVPLHGYYWRIDMYDDSMPEPPAQPSISQVFVFNTNNQPPVVDANDVPTTWLNEGGTVDFNVDGALIEDDELPEAASLLWTVTDPNLTILTDPALPVITVRSTGAGLFTITLTADDTELTGSDTTSVLIYEDWCVAIKAMEGLIPRMTDHNGDCVTDVLDFAIFAREWLLRIDQPSPL